MTRYRKYRAMGLSRRSALTWLLPIRLRLMYAVARGWPVIYRVVVNGRVILEVDHAHVVESAFRDGVGFHASSHVDFEG